ncbi:MAG: SDR family oxidoreductase, partial [Caldilineaceae bacterium]|nr:SDR family oxidoreductase [Caldilineaceae bacterium]
VTGGNRGIGATCVRLLEGQGAKVAYNYRSKPNEESPSLAIQADITSLESMEGLAAEVEEKLGPIWGVVANAGVTNDALFSRMSHEQWLDVVNTNLNGAFNTIRPIISGMYERQSGSIVLISSLVGQQGNIGQANYGATKAGLIGLAKTLGLEGARYGVRANALCPGFTETDMLKSIPEEVKQKIYKTIPLRRFATEEEIAWGVVYLLSPVTGGYITGTTLSINGGRYT